MRADYPDQARSNGVFAGNVCVRSSPSPLGTIQKPPPVACTGDEAKREMERKVKKVRKGVYSGSRPPPCFCQIL